VLDFRGIAGVMLGRDIISFTCPPISFSRFSYVLSWKPITFKRWSSLDSRWGRWCPSWLPALEAVTCMEFLSGEGIVFQLLFFLFISFYVVNYTLTLLFHCIVYWEKSIGWVWRFAPGVWPWRGQLCGRESVDCGIGYSMSTWRQECDIIQSIGGRLSFAVQLIASDQRLVDVEAFLSCHPSNWPANRQHINLFRSINFDALRSLVGAFLPWRFSLSLLWLCSTLLFTPPSLAQTRRNTNNNLRVSITTSPFLSALSGNCLWATC
jgi:hypothetical protein